MNSDIYLYLINNYGSFYSSASHKKYKKNLKAGLLTLPLSIDNSSANEKKLFFSFTESCQGDLIKTIFFNDVELFYNKAIIQYGDYLNYIKQSARLSSSNTWKYVTLYYLLFFLVTTLSRYLKNGFIYFNSEDIKIINNNSTENQSSLEKGTYEFSYENNKIIIKKSSLSVHEITWINFTQKILPEFKKEIQSYKNKEEQDLIDLFISQFKNLGKTFPSSYRNEINYQGVRSSDELNKKIVPIIHEHLKNFYYINNDNKNKEVKKSQVSYYLTIYLFNLVQLIVNDMLDRQDKISELTKLRNKYIKEKEIDISHFLNLM